MTGAQECKHCGTFNLPYVDRCDTCLSPLREPPARGPVAPTSESESASTLQHEPWLDPLTGLPFRYGFLHSCLTYGLRYASIVCVVSALALSVIGGLALFGFEFIPNDWPLVAGFGGFVGIYLIVSMAFKGTLAQALCLAGALLLFGLILTGAARPSTLWNLLAAVALLIGARAMSVAWRSHHKLRMRRTYLHDKREFVFVLRSFKSIETNVITTTDRLIQGGTARRRHHVLELLEWALAPSYGLVFLQYQAHSVMYFTRALQIDTASNWVPWFEDICARARAIVLLPEISEGVLQEIAILRTRGWMGKTLMISLPSDAADDRWERVRTHFLTAGLSLPKRDPEGGIYRVSEDGTAVRSHPLAQIEIALADRSLRGQPTRVIAGLAMLAEDGRLPPAG